MMMPIAQQLLTAFDALKSIGVIHADLKPDNIMLVNYQDQPFRVKLIDFGLSWSTSVVKQGMRIQVAYRAPEVFLGLPPSEAVDMWALGCVLAMLYLSSNLFGSGCDDQVMRNMVEIVGRPPDHLLRAGSFTQQFFTENPYLDKPKWWLKTPAEYHQDTGIQPQLFTGAVNSLRDLLIDYFQVEEVIEMEDRRAFMSFMMGLLDIDPELRISPEKALKHPYVSMVHLEKEMDPGVYVSASYDRMMVDLMDESEDKIIIEDEDPSPAAGSASPDNIWTTFDGAGAVADGSIEEDPAEEEPGSDPNGPPAEGVPKKERVSRLRRVKKFFTRAIRRLFRLRKTSDGPQ